MDIKLDKVCTLIIALSKKSIADDTVQKKVLKGEEDLSIEREKNCLTCLVNVASCKVLKLFSGVFLQARKATPYLSAEAVSYHF